jgi:hypothetical protein
MIAGLVQAGMMLAEEVSERYLIRLLPPDKPSRQHQRPGFSREQVLWVRAVGWSRPSALFNAGAVWCPRKDHLTDIGRF